MRRRPMRGMNAFRARLEETRGRRAHSRSSLLCSVSDVRLCFCGCFCAPGLHLRRGINMIEIANFIQDLDGLKSPSSALRSRAQGPERRSLPRRRGETGFCQRHQQFDRAVITRRCLLPELLEHGLHSS